MIVQSSNPNIAAGELLRHLGSPLPNELNLEDVVWSIGAIFKEAKIEGSDGRIIMAADNAIVTVNSAISHLGKRNYVIAHEIGHFLLHQNINRYYFDNDESLSAWYAKGTQEQQANDFATELLMPADKFKYKIKGKRLSLDFMREISTYFQVSLTNSFLRYRNLGDYPLMIVFLENGLVQWKQLSSDFPFQYLPLKSKVPVYSVAGDFFYNNSVEDSPVLVDAIEWFPEDYRIKYDRTAKLWEQVFKISDKAMVSCLWTQ